MNNDKTTIGNVAVGSSAVTVAIATILATFASSFGVTAASTIGFTEPNAAISIRPDYGITNVTAQMGTNAYLPCKVSIGYISYSPSLYLSLLSVHRSTITTDEWLRKRTLVRSEVVRVQSVATISSDRDRAGKKNPIRLAWSGLYWFNLKYMSMECNMVSIRSHTQHPCAGTYS